MSADREGVPSDAELEQEWNGPDSPAAHKAAWVLHQEQESREIEASNARENDFFAQNYERREAQG